MHPIDIVKKIMTEFADSTGLTEMESPPRRYLWTDAFAVCNFIELHRQTRAENWRRLALALVDQVHSNLGRHRKDDARTGWISGLSEDEGRRHPTAGGLRIGKPIKERGPGDPFDQRLEWDRDGQYYHYLTKWMHALNRLSRSTGDAKFNLWAIELAKAAHSGFVHVLQNDTRRMYWKMSIDLSYPLVPSMGQHDPLDGLVTYHQLRATAGESAKASLDLTSEIAEMAALCRGRSWETEDPLGIGGLLTDAYKLVQLIANYGVAETGLLQDLLEASLWGLDALRQLNPMNLPAGHRLAFRELGLSIGLRAVEKIRNLAQARPDEFKRIQPAYAQIGRLAHFVRLGESIAKFWLETRNRESQTWADHQDINSVMLATSLLPDGYLEI